MGRLKKSKGKMRLHLSEKMQKKLKSSERKVNINPFEIQINRQKHHVLGQKLKTDRGLPGVSRSRALEKRKKTLLKEYKLKNKANVFKDRRIGEYNVELKEDEKAIARLVHEKKRLSKTDIYNLNEEGELTHLGQSIADIEKYDDPRSDSEEEGAKLGADFVKEVHFGGFLTKKDENAVDSSGKSRKEIIEEMIAQSKQKKHERQKERETTLELTEKLDSDFKTFQALLGDVKRKEKEETSEKNDYDLMVKELKFEARGMVSDRLKTQEELAKEEREKLDKLEADRKRRMKGIVEKTDVSGKHVSADDLDDGLYLGRDDVHSSSEQMKEKENCDYAIDDEQLPTEDEGHEVDTDEALECGDDKDSYSDLQSEDEEKDVVSPDHGSCKMDDLKSDFKKRKLIMEKARKELPYIFSVPQTYEEFTELLIDRNSAETGVIVERIIKSNHPELVADNHTKLEVFFRILLQYLNDLCVSGDSSLNEIDILVPQLYNLSQLSPVATAQSVLDVILEKQENFDRELKIRGNGYVNYPGLDSLIFLKLASILYPTSDFRHPVVTVASLFMSQLLTSCIVTRYSDIYSGLFLCSLFLEYVSYAKRFVPEAVNFLQGILFLGSVKDGQFCSVFPPFKPCRNYVKLSVIKPNKECQERPSLTVSQIRAQVPATEDDHVSILWCAVHLLNQFSSLYRSLPSYSEIFSPAILLCKKLPVEMFPDMFIEDLQKLELCQNDVVKAPLVQEHKKPKPLKLFEPRVEEVFDGRKQRGGGKDKQQRDKLLHKYKRELKGAIREVRRDNQFLAREWLNEKLERDAERKKKVQELYQSLAQQEGDFKALKRKKK